MTKINTLKTKRFVIRKNLIGKGVIINFTNKEGKSFKYNHDEVFKVNKQRFEAMNCFKSISLILLLIIFLLSLEI